MTSDKGYGLIGFPLGHSFSVNYFADKFAREQIQGCSYQNFPLQSIDELPALLHQHPNLQGFNVTIPYKEAILPYLHALSDEARAIGAVNCVKINPQGLCGYNTDAYGFAQSLRELLGDVRPEGALILGTGGASKAVAYVLSELGIPWRKVSRYGGEDRFSYAELTPEVIAHYPLLVNTTPLGTFPNVAECPDLPYEALTAGHFLFDLVYNPPLTEFLRRGALQGAATKNGYDMLVGQAEKAWQIWSSSDSKG